MRKIPESELVLNPDGSVYHLNLKPENIAKTIIFVGDPDRVPKVAKHFDSIAFKTQKREFKTVTGTYKEKKLSVISTGIGPDNIDIVINELDALFNIDLKTRKIKENHIELTFVRIGTSGSLQKDIPVDEYVLAQYGLGFDGMLWSYACDKVLEKELSDAFLKHTRWHSHKVSPYFVQNAPELSKKLSGGKKVHYGITATTNGFFGPQGRVLRLKLQNPEFNKKIASFYYKDLRVTNFEMETSAIYGLAKLLGHKACSINCIIANRANATFSKDPYKAIEGLIQYTLDKLVE